MYKVWVGNLMAPVTNHPFHRYLFGMFFSTQESPQQIGVSFFVCVFDPFFHGMRFSRCHPTLVQAGPIPVINGVITPFSRVITPITHYKAIYGGEITPLVTGLGSPLVGEYVRHRTSKSKMPNHNLFHGIHHHSKTTIWENMF